MRALFLLLNFATTLFAYSSKAPIPFDLLVSFKPVPAFSVPVAPQFGWTIPPSVSIPDATQIAYQIVVSTAFTEDNSSLWWNSGRVVSNASIGIKYDGLSLPSGRAFVFNITVWLSDNSSPVTSMDSIFTTALDSTNWAPDAGFIWSSNISGIFALFRRVVSTDSIKSPISLALLHASAQTGDDTILEGYTAYINGILIGIGPGRGEARIWDNDGIYRALPYDTYNVTAALAIDTANITIAAASVGGENVPTRGLFLQLDLFFSNGDMQTILATDSNFLVFQSDNWLVPTDFAKPYATAYHHKLEYTDARLEPIGWKSASFLPSPGLWQPANVTLPVNSSEAISGLTAKMAPSVVVHPVNSTDQPAVIIPMNSTFGFIDFQKEFQGGLSMTVLDGVAGVRITLVSGESQTNGIVGSTWGYKFTWTLRDGVQVIDQLQYMEFRYVNVILESDNNVIIPLNSIEIRAWRIAAAWDDSKSFFYSSNSSLNKIWAQSRYTIEAGLLDTYTDSNTRERRPYECDGLITASSRLLLQGDVSWVRHSHSYVFYKPTWPVEWQQMGAILALQDYWATGSTDLASAYFSFLYTNTHYSSDVDSTGLLNTSYGRHIIDWDPWPTQEEYHQSEHFSVTQFWALAGLRSLQFLATVNGSNSEAATLAAQVALLNSTIYSTMMNETTGLFCDGICLDERVAGFTSTFSSAWALATGALEGVSQSLKSSAWQHVSNHGLNGYGSYGAFMMLSALNAFPDGDDGTSTLTALTKCDYQSWCAEMEEMNATMTRESWLDPTATYSHPWGTSPIIAIVHGVMGLRQTSASWESFSVEPHLGGIESANITIPTLRGLITVIANATHTAVVIPCGSRATICAKHGYSSGGEAALNDGRILTLDDVPIKRESTISKGMSYLCVVNVGCGVSGGFRTGTVV
jgi:alpha-L-rhamnosidase